MTEDFPVVTAAVCEWQPMSSAPVGAKCLLLTVTGMAVVGRVPTNKHGYDAWAPLPKRPLWMRQ
jgi:hypothetical protein